MFVIRRKQIEFLEQSALYQFESETVAHLRRFAPGPAEGMSEAGLRQVVRAGTERAGAYGFTNRGPVRFFIELMIMFGYEFDTDPMLAWAKGLSRQEGWKDQLARADRLHAEAMAYRDAVIGKGYELESAAIRRLTCTPVDKWLSKDLSDKGLDALFREIYPEKAEHAEAGAVASIIARGRGAAQKHLLPPETGGAVCAALMLAFGQGCLADPQFRWLAASLEDGRGPTAEKRAERLAIRAMAYLHDGLREMERG
jgi:hypothetical protein